MESRSSKMSKSFSHKSWTVAYVDATLTDAKTGKARKVKQTLIFSLYNPLPEKILNGWISRESAISHIEKSL